MPANVRRRLVLAASALCVATVARGATVTVTGTGDSVALDGSVTLREAIASINAGANVDADVAPVGAYGTGDTIAFGIPGAGPHTILIGATPLPVIAKPVNISGYTQPGSVANTLAVGDGAVLNVVLQGTTAGLHGLEIGPGGAGSVISGLVLQHHFFAIQINASDVVVNGNFIGTDRGATMADATTANAIGINVSTGAIGNTVIGGSTPAERNVISGNAGGIVLNSQLPNTIRGNYIGTSGTGLAAIPNTAEAIRIGSVGAAILGGATIGGTTAIPGQGAGNVISGNGAQGIHIETTGPPSVIGAVTIQGNILGLDANGANALPNTGNNVEIRDVDLPSSGIARVGPVTIGGSAAGAGNVLASGGHGVFSVAAGTVIQGNRIGTDITGTLARPNTFGIEITGTSAFAGGATIGGSGANEGNVVSGNASDAIRVFLATATIQGNRIGTTPAGAPLGNGGYGVFVDSGETTIGGSVAGAGNVIANSGDTGVHVRIGSPAAHNASNAAILGNSITQNALLGINDSAPDLVTPNDAGDGDSGPNGLQNFPVVTGATAGGGNVSVSGTLNSAPNATFRVELFSNAACDTSGNGEGGSFLGFVDVTTDAGGNGSFGPSSFPLPAGETVITATATSAANQTSEFSACVTATGAPVLPTLSIDSPAANEGDAGTTPFVFTVTLSADPAAPVTVAYATADGTGAAPGDYATTGGVLTFLPGGPLTQQIVVPVVGETAVEANETFFVDLSSPAGATVLVSRGTGTIVNDDAAEPAPAEIPTLSQWALLVLATGLALLGLRRLAGR